MRNNKDYSTAIVRNSLGELETICLDTGEVISSVSSQDLSKYRFNLETAALICQSIREGKTLKAIGEDTNFPSLQVVHYWRRTNATFDAEIKLARKERAEYYHDKVLDITDSVMDKDEVAVARFKTEQYKWAAEKGDPSSFGNKIEHTGNNTAPAFIVITGVPRRKIDIEVESKEVVNEQKDEITDGGRPVCGSEPRGIPQASETESEGSGEEEKAGREE